jgi:hypothetical protein
MVAATTYLTAGLRAPAAMRVITERDRIRQASVARIAESV